MDTQSMPGLVDSTQPLPAAHGVGRRFGAVEKEVAA